MLNTVSVYTASDLSHSNNCNPNKPTDTLANIAKVGEHTANEDCSCVFATFRPVRIEFDPYSQLFAPKLESKKQKQNTNVREFVGRDIGKNEVCKDIFAKV